PQPRGLVGFLRVLDSSACSAHGRECLIEILVRGEPVGGELGRARKLLLGIATRMLKTPQSVSTGRHSPIKAGPTPGLWRCAGSSSLGGRRQVAQAQPSQREEGEGHARQDRKRHRGLVHRRSPRCLIEQDLLIPADREQRPPVAREDTHSEPGSSTPAYPKAGGAMIAVRLRPRGRLRTSNSRRQRLIAAIKRAAATTIINMLAAIGQPKPGMENQHVDPDQREKDEKQREQFAGERDGRASPRAAQPGDLGFILTRN
ncbi:MAG: hypothetical protein WA633_26040, partial [Stellaceae bacterium]